MGHATNAKKRLMGRSQMKTRRKALLYSGVFVALNQRTMKNNRIIFLYQSITGETITTFFSHLISVEYSSNMKIKPTSKQCKSP